MADVSSPYGLAPINLLGGQPFAGSTRMYKIASGYAVTLQQFDPVVLLSGAAGGVVNRINATTTQGTATTTGTPLGVFMGCTYTDPALGPTWRSNYASGTVATDIVAYVVDDPDTMFRVQANAPMTQINVGCNYSLIQTVAGSAVLNRMSGIGLATASANSTATLPVRMVGVWEGPGNSLTSAFPDVIVRFNNHFFGTTTGNQLT